MRSITPDAGSASGYALGRLNFDRAAKMGALRFKLVFARMYTNGQFVDTDCRKAAELFAQGEQVLQTIPIFR